MVGHARLVRSCCLCMPGTRAPQSYMLDFKHCQELVAAVRTSLTPPWRRRGSDTIGMRPAVQNGLRRLRPVWSGRRRASRIRRPRCNPRLLGRRPLAWAVGQGLTSPNVGGRPFGDKYYDSFWLAFGGRRPRPVWVSVLARFGGSRKVDFWDSVYGFWDNGGFGYAGCDVPVMSTSCDLSSDRSLVAAMQRKLPPKCTSRTRSLCQACLTPWAHRRRGGKRAKRECEGVWWDRHRTLVVSTNGSSRILLVALASRFGLALMWPPTGGLAVVLSKQADSFAKQVVLCACSVWSHICLKAFMIATVFLVAVRCVDRSCGCQTNSWGHVWPHH